MTQINAAKIARGVFWTTASYGYDRFITLILQVILARLLSPKEFGIWAMAQLLINLSTLFSEGVIAQVLIQRGLTDKKLLNTVYSLGINVSVILCVLQVLGGFLLAKFFATPILWPLTACVGLRSLITAGASTHNVVMVRQMRFRELTVCQGISGIAQVGGAMTCVALGGGIWSFVAGELSKAVSFSLLLRSQSGYHFTYHLIPDWATVHKVKGFISGMVGINLGVYFNTYSDNLVIGKLIGKEALGEYNMAYQLAMLPHYSLSRIEKVNFSVLSQKDNEGKQAYVLSALELVALISALINGVGFVVSPWLIPMVYGPKWVGAVPLFQIILIYAYARGFMNILGICLVASNRPNINAAINWVLVPISVCSYTLGAQLGGTTGVAIAVAVVMGVGASLLSWQVMCHVLGWKITTLVKPVLLPTATMSVTVATVLAIPFPADLQAYLQPLTVVLGYSMSLAILSRGRIPRMLMDVVKRSLNRQST